MVSQLTVESVDLQDRQYVVKFRDTDTFDELVSPDWAQELAEAEVPDSDVRMGQDESGDWLVQTVMVPRTTVEGEEDASRKALKVVTAISERDQPD